MATKRRVGTTQATDEGMDALAGKQVRPRTGRDRAREAGLAEAEAAEGLPTAEEPDLGPPVSERQLDERDQRQSAKRKKPGPKRPETPAATPVAPPSTAPPPTDPE